VEVKGNSVSSSILAWPSKNQDIPVANLDVKLSMMNGALDYEKHSLANVTELYSKGFNVTIPPNTYDANNKAGTWRAGSQGWWVFLS
jgi:hypothetical protein